MRDGVSSCGSPARKGSRARSHAREPEPLARAAQLTSRTRPSEAVSSEHHSLGRSTRSAHELPRASGGWKDVEDGRCTKRCLLYWQMRRTVAGDEALSSASTRSWRRPVSSPSAQSFAGAAQYGVNPSRAIANRSASPLDHRGRIDRYVLVIRLRLSGSERFARIGRDVDPASAGTLNLRDAAIRRSEAALAARDLD